MKLVSSFLSFVFTLIFFTQSSAWATGVTSPYSPIILEKAIEKYNSLSQEEKKEEFLKIMGQRPKSDQEFIKKSAGDLPKFIFPEAILEKGSIVFRVKNRSLSMVPKSNNIMLIEGEEVDFSPGHLERATDKLERIFSKKSFSLMDLFITSSYAFGLSFILCLVLFGVLIAGLLSYMKKRSDPETIAKNTKDICEKLRKKVDEVQFTPPSKDLINELTYKIKSALYDLDADPECGQYKHLLPQNKMKCQNFSNIVGCLNGLRDELSGHSQGVNKSGRGVKEINQRYHSGSTTGASGTPQ